MMIKFLVENGVFLYNIKKNKAKKDLVSLKSKTVIDLI